MKYIPPKAYSNTFTCPHCGAITEHKWFSINYRNQNNGNDTNAIRHSICVPCGQSTIWLKNKMLFPETGNAPFPNPEMPETVKSIYQEAASIQSKSPRGATALLRLGIQVLCKELGEKGKNINDDIASLVKKGLPDVVQQSLDIVRVTGNNAVHPGQIDVDDPEVTGKLFDLINIIVEYMIALPNKVSGLYSSLPTGAKNAINKRDQNT